MSIKSVLNITVIFMIVIFSACKDKAENMSLLPENKGTGEAKTNSISKTNNHSQQPQYLVKNGNLSFVSVNVKKDRLWIDSLLRIHAGYLVKESLMSFGSTSEYSLITKVPAQNFNKLIIDIEKNIPTLTTKNIHVIDVTEEFTDILSRIKVKKELEKRYLHLLTKTEKMDDILRLESELNKIRTDIEAQEGRNQVLAHKIAFSTLEILIRNKIPEKNENTYFGEIKIAFKNGLKYVGMFSLLLVNLWPFICFGVVIYAFIIRKKKKTEH